MGLVPARKVFEETVHDVNASGDDSGDGNDQSGHYGAGHGWDSSKLGAEGSGIQKVGCIKVGMFRPRRNGLNLSFIHIQPAARPAYCLPQRRGGEAQ